MIAEDRLARVFLETHPPRAGRALAQMPTARAAAVLRGVPPELAATVIPELTVPHAADCLTLMNAAEAAAIVAELTTDDAVGIVRAMEPQQRDPLLAALPERLGESIARVLPYPEGTAGAVMDASVFRLPEDVIVADARVRLGRAARELLYYIYVVDREHRLAGVLDIPELMLARARDPVSAAMHRDVDRVSVWMPVALVRAHIGWQRYHALPVVDEEQRLLGAIRYQTLRRLEREASASEPNPGRLTAGALAELFQLGTTGFVAGIAATASAPSESGNEGDAGNSGVARPSGHAGSAGKSDDAN